MIQYYVFMVTLNDGICTPFPTSTVFNIALIQIFKHSFYLYILLKLMFFF